MPQNDSSSIKKIFLSLLCVIVGGFLGTMARYGITNAIKRDSRTEFMLGTWVSNILGCFIGGFLMSFSDYHGWVDYGMAFLSVGFCGSLTTFGGYTYDVILKLENPKHAGLGVGEFFAMVASCMFFASCGYFISSKLIKPHLPKPKSDKDNNQNKPDNQHHSRTPSNSNGDEREPEMIENQSIPNEQL